jgi:CheY-like chemotaxis protein
VTLAAAAPAAVLVVDDQEGSRHVFASWLRRAGHVVHEAGTGAEALDLLARHGVQLVLLDVHLPDMSGLEVCERIKANRATSGVPVLHVSATATGADDRVQALNRGSDGYLIEPIERDELLANVTALLRYHEARRSAEQLASSLERLHQATLLMNAATRIGELLQVAGTGLVSVFGRPTAVLVARDGVGRCVVAGPSDDEPEVRRYAAPLIVELAATTYADEPVPPETVELLFGHRSAVIATAVAAPRGELLGAIVLQGQPSRSDELMLDHFGQAFAVALENQRLYAVEHSIARTLQRAMLPAAVPQPSQLELAVSYHAVSDAAEVGGDFYDAIEVDPNTTLVAVGDVAGHSLRAATVMAELRHTLHALAALGLPGAEIAERLNDSLIEGHPNLTATLAVAVIDTANGVVHITNAGQIPPLLVRDGQVEIVAEHGALLGVRTGSGRPTSTHAFPPGATLVIATDGLIERREEDLRTGIDRLRVVVADYDGPMDRLCQRLIDEIGSGSFDDIAILAAHRQLAP